MSEQLHLFDEFEQKQPTQEAAQGIGSLIAKKILDDPDLFGSDWPSATVLKPEWREAHPERTVELLEEADERKTEKLDRGYMGQLRSKAADDRQRNADKAFLKNQHRKNRSS